jgi:thymidylate synthase
VFIKAATLDDLLGRAFKSLLKSKVRLTATKGSNVEISGVVFELTSPRARLSRTESKGHAFSCLGEFLWYASKSDALPFIRHYISRYSKFADDDGRIWGAYGPRIFSGQPSQYEVVKEILKRKSTSRQAVIQIFDQQDIEHEHRDVPCTLALQFLVRDGRLELVTQMRSNDAFMGFPHDVFAFTMIQELMARDLDLALGSYKHMVGSLHLYDTDSDKVKRYLDEGVQSTKEMPSMPEGSQWPQISLVLEAESVIRNGSREEMELALSSAAQLDSYWADIVKLLAIFTLTKGLRDSHI